jgi:hypothetical protein
MEVLLLWRANGEIHQEISTSLQLVAADGARVTQDDGPPAHGIISTTEFKNISIPDSKRLWIPSDLPDNHYRLELVAYDAVTHDPVADPIPLEWFRMGPSPAPPAIARQATWEGGIQLVGYDGLPSQVAPGAVLPLRLVWQTNSPIDADYTTFVHVVDDRGNLISQHDTEPEGGFYPTSHWKTAEPVADDYSLSIPASAPPGEYRVLVGWYSPESGQRLLLHDGGDRVEIGRIQVE